MIRRIAVGIAVVLLLMTGCGDAAAWGCDGHRAIAFLAERLLSPTTLASVKATLAAAPTDPALARFCDPVPDDPIADSATWADDYRNVDATTFGWHFIDVPRNLTLTTANASTWCSGGNCVVDAITASFVQLTTSNDGRVRGKALRFLLHLVGDVHQPLHATTNGDRGGNCVPVTYFDRAPQPNAGGEYSPNLHSVWDTYTIRRLMTTRGLQDARALAGYIAATRPLPAGVTARRPTKEVVITWAQGAHVIAGNVAYGRLPHPIATEPASAASLPSCAGNRDVGHRMLDKHEVIDSPYEQASIPAIIDQLRLAGIRLGAVLKAAFP